MKEGCITVGDVYKCKGREGLHKEGKVYQARKRVEQVITRDLKERNVETRITEPKINKTGASLIGHPGERYIVSDMRKSWLLGR